MTRNVKYKIDIFFNYIFQVYSETSDRQRKITLIYLDYKNAELLIEF